MDPESRGDLRVILGQVGAAESVEQVIGAWQGSVRCPARGPRPMVPVGAALSNRARSASLSEVISAMLAEQVVWQLTPSPLPLSSGLFS